MFAALLVLANCSNPPPPETASGAPASNAEAEQDTAPGTLEGANDSESEGTAKADDAEGVSAMDSAGEPSTPTESTSKAAQESTCKKAPARPKDGVFFAPESSDIPKDELGFLEGMAQSLRESSGSNGCIEVLGYADPTEGNKADWLSRLRAERVVKELERRGVPRKRIKKVLGYGVGDAVSVDGACDEAARQAIRAWNRSARISEIPCG